MSFKIVAITAFFAALAAASPVTRQSSLSASIVNNIPDGTVINYAVISEAPSGGCGPSNCVVTSGSVAQGATQDVPLNPAGQGGYSVKLCSGSCDPATQGANGILQYEYTLSSDGTFISYDWSCVNCDPNPFENYTYTMAPYAGAPTESGSNQCETITCAAGTDDTQSNCQFGYNAPVGFNPPNCPLDGTTGVVLTGTFS